MDIPALVSRQKDYFYGGATLDTAGRKEALIALRNAILSRKRTQSSAA